MQIYGLWCCAVLSACVLFAACRHSAKPDRVSQRQDTTAAAASQPGPSAAFSPAAAEPPTLTEAFTPGRVGRMPDAFIPEGYAEVERAQGDLNSDGIDDYALLLRPLRDSVHTPRHLLVLLGMGIAGEVQLLASNNRIFGPEYNEFDYRIRPDFSLDIRYGELLTEQYDIGPSGNLSTSFRMISDHLYLATLETYNMGAGSHIGTTYNPLEGTLTVVETVMLTDTANTKEEVHRSEPARILFSDCDPDAEM